MSEIPSPRDLALRALEEVGLTSIPVPIDEVCVRLGIIVEEVPLLSQGWDGFWVPLRTGRVAIFVKQGLGRRKRRFTVAHELGHIRRHHLSKNPYRIHRKIILAELRSDNLRKSRYMTDFLHPLAQADERYVSDFAQNLLVPPQVCVEAHGRDYDLTNLAEILGAPTWVVAAQLVETAQAGVFMAALKFAEGSLENVIFGHAFPVPARTQVDALIRGKLSVSDFVSRYVDDSTGVLATLHRGQPVRFAWELVDSEGIRRPFNCTLYPMATTENLEATTTREAIAMLQYRQAWAEPNQAETPSYDSKVQLMLLKESEASRSQVPRSGRIEVITGCVFSGKTEELIRRLRRAEIAKQNVVAFKWAHVKDTEISTHETPVEGSTRSLTALSVRHSNEIQRFVRDHPETSVIGIDNAHWFDASLHEVCDRLAGGRLRLIVAGLDQRFDGTPFSTMSNVMSIADHVEKLTAICMNCRGIATRSQFIRVSGSGSAIEFSTSPNAYEARCRSCWVPHQVPPSVRPSAQ